MSEVGRDRAAPLEQQHSVFERGRRACASEGEEERKKPRRRYASLGIICDATKGGSLLGHEAVGGIDGCLRERERERTERLRRRCMSARG